MNNGYNSIINNISIEEATAKKDKKERKDKNIIARCTSDEKQKIIELAKKANKSESKYIIDSALAANERRGDIKKRYNAIRMISLNDIEQLRFIINSNACDATREQMLNIIKDMEELTKCQN